MAIQVLRTDDLQFPVAVIIGSTLHSLTAKAAEGLCERLLAMPACAELSERRAKRHEAEVAELVGVCKQALYALKGREHDQFLRDTITKYEVKK